MFAKKYTKKPWCPRDDAILMDTIDEIGRVNWNVIASRLPGRTGKQCRERYNNHLLGDIVKGHWTEEEEAIVISSHSRLGNQWANIARLLPGRSCNDVKNRCKSLQKRGSVYRSHYNLTLQREIISDKFKFLRKSSEFTPPSMNDYNNLKQYKSETENKMTSYNSDRTDMGTVFQTFSTKDSFLVMDSMFNVSENIENIDNSVQEGLFYFQNFLQSLENRCNQSMGVIV